MAENVVSGEMRATTQTQTSRQDVPQRERQKPAHFDSYVF